MYLQINEKYRIAGDKRQWMIQAVHKRKNKETGKVENGWESESFFISLESAVNHLAERQVRECSATNITEALEVLKVITKELTGALTPSFTVESK